MSIEVTQREAIARIIDSYAWDERGPGFKMTARREEARDKADAIIALHAAPLREALEWYAEQVAGCRKSGNIGDPFRHALDDDGGKRARSAVSPSYPMENYNGE